MTEKSWMTSQDFAKSDAGGMISGGADIASSLIIGGMQIAQNEKNRKEARELADVQRGDVLNQNKVQNTLTASDLALRNKQQQMNHEMTVQAIQFENWMRALSSKKQKRMDAEEKKSLIAKKYRGDEQKRNAIFGMKKANLQGDV